jgi:hypothetical protein
VAPVPRRPKHGRERLPVLQRPLAVAEDETLLVLLAKLPTIGFLGGQMAAGVLMCVPVAAVMAAALVWLERRSVRG